MNVNRNHRLLQACATVAVVGLFFLGSPNVHAGIADDLAAATIVEEFLFDDAVGTTLDMAANNVTANLFDMDADTADVVTTGSGQLNASLKNNVDFGTNYVDNATLTPSVGRVLGVMELQWNFQSVLDPAENEEIRISLIQEDPRSTFVVAEWEIQREDDDTLTILGNAVGTGSTDLGPVVLNGGSLSQTGDNFIAVIDADMGSDQYWVHFSSDGGASFTTLGPGALDPDRNTIESLRLTLNNDLFNDRVLIDRIYLATIAVPEPATLMSFLAGALGLVLVRRRS